MTAKTPVQMLMKWISESCLYPFKTKNNNRVREGGSEKHVPRTGKCDPLIHLADGFDGNPAGSRMGTLLLSAGLSAESLRQFPGGVLPGHGIALVGGLTTADGGRLLLRLIEVPDESPPPSA